MTTIQIEREAGPNDRLASALALTVFALLGLAAVVGAIVFTVGAFGQSPLSGMWVGRDDTGAEVVYHFAPDGTGYRRTADCREDLTWSLSEGYPNELRLRLSSDGDTVDFRALVEFVSDARIRLEVGARDRPAPRRMGPAALELRRPPTR